MHRLRSDVVIDPDITGRYISIFSIGLLIMGIRSSVLTPVPLEHIASSCTLLRQLNPGELVIVTLVAVHFSFKVIQVFIDILRQKGTILTQLSSLDPVTALVALPCVHLKCVYR